MSEPTQIDKQFEFILESLGKIDERLDRIESTQEEHGKLLAQLVESQRKQDHLLELLTLRSVDQEVEINMIKEAI